MKVSSPFDQRRRLLCVVAPTVALAVIGCKAARDDQESAHGKKEEEEEAEVTPGEDLMQEHGVVERILLVYGEAQRRIVNEEDLDPAVIAQTAGLVRRFVQDYHEKNEEKHVFPRLRSAGREVELVDTLLLQHDRGRQLTDAIMRLSRSRPTPELAQSLRDFERMYRPHAAREDTVVFPAFRELLDRDEYRELGEKFEEDEKKRFGENGFERNVAEIAAIERTLGIDDLARFTPPPRG
jgi:hemerythrin-like domain-containing protein